MEKLVKVYKASAGSGKTHTLTNEYIDIILKDELAYKHLLAVTFTNKATDEMKQRILKELHKLANTPGQRGEMARSVLIRILHDYSAFAVSTIDRFFQGIMRAFARELGRMVTYSVELDSDMVRMAAIDNMFANLDKKEYKKLLEWLIGFSLERIENGESWKIEGEISKLSESLFSESFKLKNGGFSSQSVALELSERISRISELKSRLRQIKKEFEGEAFAISKRALDIIAGAGLDVTDFKGGKNGAMRTFQYLASGLRFDQELKATFLSLYNAPELWYPKSRSKEAYKYEEASNAGLNGAIGELISLYDSKLSLYLTVGYVERNLNSLGILGSIYDHILQYCREKNIILLSETTELLGRIIDGSDTPFIYERTGTWINNFMLDEFQDTSTMQWRNFEPLLSNSIANGDVNLIVGDVKQSIYRFRNSNWEILKSGIDDEFGDAVFHDKLKFNWRSAANIVDFNNDFFKYAAKAAKFIYNPMFALAEGEFSDDDPLSRHYSGVIEEIYKDLEQKLPDEKSGEDGGFVEISLFCKSDIKDGGWNYDEVVRAYLLKSVARVIRNGYRQKKIGILVRNRYQGSMVAQWLIGEGYRVISSDSLLISSSEAVNGVVNILKWIEDPDNISIKIYSILSKGNSKFPLPSPEECERLKVMPLYQMCEEVIRCHLPAEHKEDIAFLQLFLDLVLDFNVKNGSNLSAFLKWWGEDGCRKSISSPEEQDAIQVMTIHKAKGLAFDVVILPFFNSPLDHYANKSPLLWSNALSKVVGYDSPLPVRYGSGLKKTLFKEDYYQEKMEAFIDNLNLAYVAFTRPRRELIIFAETPDRDKYGDPKEDSAVSHILTSYLEHIEKKEDYNIAVREKTAVVGDEKITSLTYTIGEPAKAKSVDEDDSGWFNLGSHLSEGLDLSRIATSLQSGSVNENLTLRDKGVIMHDIFAGIRSKEDVCRIQDPQMREIVLEKLAFVEEYGWFSDSYDVYRECSIITEDGTIYRPDRILVKDGSAIVIDYKFGGYEGYNKKYHKQVKNYMQLLVATGLGSVTGYLWYVTGNKIEKVDL